MDLVRICLAGAGRAGMVHGRNFAHALPGARVAAVVDEVGAVRTAAARELNAEGHFATLDEALNLADFEAVCLASPTFTHAQLATAAARAGKHVFCEKPIAITAAEAMDMIQATRAAGVVFQIGFMRRFDQEFVDVKTLIEQGAIGDLVLIRSTTRGPGLPPPWAWDTARSNGMLAEVNSHDFDCIRWLAGSELTEVFARVKARKAEEPKRAHPDFYDVATVSIELENGALGSIEGACPVDYGYDARVEVLGTRGMLTAGEAAQGTVVRVTQDGQVVRNTFRSWRDRFRLGYMAEDQEFVECIRTGRTPRVTGMDGLRALEGVLAAIRSISSGKPEPVVRHEV